MVVWGGGWWSEGWVVIRGVGGGLRGVGGSQRG